MAEHSQRPIHTPFSHRVKLWRTTLLPAVVWVTATVAVLTLYQRQGQYLEATAVVDRHEVLLASMEDGRMVGLNAELLQRVEEGQIVGLLDTTLVEAELVIAQAELGRLRADLDANRAALTKATSERATDEFADYRRFQLNLEDARLELLDLQTAQTVEKVKRDRYALLDERQKELAEEGILEVAVYDDTRLRLETTETRIRENNLLIAMLGEQVKEAQARIDAFEPMVAGASDEDTLLAPLRESITVQQSRIQSIETRRARFVLRAPVAGEISQIFRRSGDILLAGTPILSITNPNSREAVAYLKEEDARRLSPDTPVRVVSRTKPAQIVDAKILRVGASIQQLPVNLRRVASVVEWGLPVLIGELPEGVFFPGEAIDVKFQL